MTQARTKLNPTRRRLSAGRHVRRGQVLVEAALVLPVLFLFIFGIFEYGRYLMVRHIFQNATREAARYAVSHTQAVVIGGVTYGNATSDVTNVFNQCLAGHTLTGQSTQVYLSSSTGTNLGTWTNAQVGQSICVRVTGTHRFVIPSLLNLPSSVPLDIRAVMRTEGN